VIIPKSLGNSVARHRFKRQTREILRTLLLDFPTVRQCSFLFFANKPFTQTNYYQLKYEYLKALRTINEKNNP
jgi:ribonuclease P protein component